MREFSVLLLVFASALALLILVFIGAWVFSVVAGARRARTGGTRSGPSKAGRRLLASAAAELGAEAVDSAPVPHLRSRPPDPPFGIALAPIDDHSIDYLPVFEAPVAGGVFLEAWPAGSPFPPARVSMGGGGIPVGDAAFESAYIVRSDDPHFARSLLDPESRALIEAGRRIGGGGRIRVNLDPLRLRVRKEEPLDSPADLVALARIGLGLLERVRDAVETRSAVQYYDAPPAATKPNCPVCAMAIADRPVLCRRCRTPHHPDCWDYAGGCSMFACGETVKTF